MTKIKAKNRKRAPAVAVQRMVGPRSFDDWHLRTHLRGTIGSSAYYLRREGWMASDAEKLRAVVEWIASQQNLFFAECSQAEEIVARCRDALKRPNVKVSDPAL